MRLLLVGVAILIAGCSQKSENLEMYYTAVREHDREQTTLAQARLQTIQQIPAGVTFKTSTEATLFSVIQVLMADRVNYTPIGISPPVTANDFWNKNLVGVLAVANPWLMWAAGGFDSGNSTKQSGNQSYTAGGDILVRSGNAGSYNAVGDGGTLSQYDFGKWGDTCLDCEEDALEDGAVINPVDGGVINPVDGGTSDCYSDSTGFLWYSQGCSCQSHSEGKC